MRLKKKTLNFPRVEASALTSTVGIDSLKKLTDDQLMAALSMAADVEGWQESMVKGLQKTKPDDPLIEAFIAASMHTRVAREVMAMTYTLRHPPADDGNGKPKDGGYL